MLGIALQDVCLLVFMARMDWDKEAEKVLKITKAQLIFLSSVLSVCQIIKTSLDMCNICRTDI